jgi:hypothetical protein
MLTKQQDSFLFNFFDCSKKLISPSLFGFFTINSLQRASNEKKGPKSVDYFNKSGCRAKQYYLKKSREFKVVLEFVRSSSLFANDSKGFPLKFFVFLFFLNKENQ